MIIFIKFIKILQKQNNMKYMNNAYIFIKYQRNGRTCHSMLREFIVYESSQGEETECPVCAGKEELFCRGMSEPNN